MSTVLNPYLSFAGNAREAMEFYQGVFGGALSLHTFGEFGAPEGTDPDQIMHGMLEGDGGMNLMGADTPPGMEHKPGNSMAISLSGHDADELRGYWEKLSEGATISMALEKQMWGDIYGDLTDRFGTPWAIDIGTDEGA